MKRREKFGSSGICLVMREPGENATTGTHPTSHDSSARSTSHLHRSNSRRSPDHPPIVHPPVHAKENAATIRSRRRPLQRVRRPALNAGLAWRRRGAAQRVVQSHPCKAVMAHWHWSTAEYSCLATTHLPSIPKSLSPTIIN